ncbi:MAG: Fe-S protein assembly co-chaperone HscB [Chitinophagaceae bacterium]|nr:Fe-S protein assembly co-chaperone HscB [Chitinophagaceae bacterium]
MNYFELFNIPVAFRVDNKQLTATYFELQKRYHPDRFAQAGADEQEEALRMSALVNRAYKTLKDPDETIKYLLSLKGLLEEEEKYALPPDFLMEMMELNERMEEADPGQVQAEIQQLKQDLYATVAAIVANYQEGTGTEKELLQVKDYYFRKKYLDRLAGQGKMP